MKTQIFWFHVFLILLNNIIGNSQNILEELSQNNSIKYLGTNFHQHLEYNANCCNSSDRAQSVKVEFSSEVVDNEYIVIFRGYYKKITRENYIRAALYHSGIKYWKIIPRDNLSTRYPSDFDIVLITENDKKNGLHALRNHRLVRRVTPQRVVHRTLKYINEEEDNGFPPEYKSFKRKATNNVRIN